MLTNKQISKATDIVDINKSTHENIDQANADIKKLKALLKADGFAFKISVATGHRDGH